MICALCKVYFFSAQKNFFQCREKRYGVHSKKNGERKNREKQVKFFPKSLISPIKKCNFAPGKIWIPYYSYSGSHSFQSTPTPSSELSPIYQGSSQAPSMEWRWDNDGSARGDEPKAKSKVRQRKAEVPTSSPVPSVRFVSVFPMSGKEWKTVN